MAEAFARIHGVGRVEAFSAGSRPSGKVNPRAVEVMREKGYDLSVHKSKSLDAIPPGEYEAVVTMGCGDACPFINAKHHLDWTLPDPRNMTVDGIREVRDQIEQLVVELLEKLEGMVKRDPLQSQSCAHKLAALAAPERLRIVDFLRGGPRNVSEIAENLQTAAVNVSHHVHVLLQAGLVHREKRGRFVLYSLVPGVLETDDREKANDHLNLGCCRLELPQK